MNNMTPDDRLVSRSRNLFRQSCDEIEPRHLARLAAARRNAVDPAHDTSRMALLAPIGAAAVAVLAVAVLWRQPALQPARPDSPRQLASAPAPEPDDLAFFGDLAFYEWLATQSSSANAAP